MKNKLLLVCLVFITSVAALSVPSSKSFAAAVSAPSVIYDAQVQNIGWQKDPNNTAVWFNNGQEAGTNGRSLRMETLKIALQLPTGLSGNVIYDAHVQNIGWQNAAAPLSVNNPQTLKPTSEWFSNGAAAGTVGKSLRMEAFTAQLTGQIANYYDIIYDSHVQNIGWQAAPNLYAMQSNPQAVASETKWFKNGQEVGTNDRSLRMEALEIKLVPKAGITIKNVTVNKDTAGNILSTTSGCTQASNSTSTSISGSTITYTTTVTWNKPAAALFSSASKSTAIANDNSAFNQKLEAAMLQQINAYRAHYDKAALTINPTLDSFAHSNIAWSVNPTNQAAVLADGHIYFENNYSVLWKDSTIAANRKVNEVATILNDQYSLEAGNVLGTATTKDTINTVATGSTLAKSLGLTNTSLNIDLMNAANNNTNVLNQLAYTLVYMYGNDGQPVGYDGTTSANQGTAHKQGILSAVNSVGFGIGFDKNGYIQTRIDLS